MPIRTIYKLRAQRPNDITTLAGKHALMGNIYVDKDMRAVMGLSLGKGTCIGYFLPSAKVKPNCSAMKPLTLHKVNGYKRPDTGEILMIFKNVNYHFSGFMQMTDSFKRSNCTLNWDSSIIINRHTHKGDILICFMNGWEEIDNTLLPQYKRHCLYNNKYSFTTKKRRKVKLSSVIIPQQTQSPPIPPKKNEEEDPIKIIRDVDCLSIEKLVAELMNK